MAYWTPGRLRKLSDAEFAEALAVAAKVDAAAAAISDGRLAYTKVLRERAALLAQAALRIGPDNGQPNGDMNDEEL